MEELGSAGTERLDEVILAAVSTRFIATFGALVEMPGLFHVGALAWRRG
jgi:hypothetical protein